ncbi:MAG: cytochrome c oxidase assembly protein, partial [Patescibacteria group bacterium]|nr:cytochrome c oxidase assembly protein [Patescibacteria group bacterium]
MNISKRNKIVGAVLSLFIVIMFLFAYANVPLFKLFCSAVGIQLSPNEKVVVKNEPAGREIEVQFSTIVADNLPIIFNPKERTQKIHLGVPSHNPYRFVNMSDRSVYFRPVHSVLPQSASKKLTMTECFCFKDMLLEPKEERSVPMTYVFHKDLDRGVMSITMNYTIFKR